MLWLLGIVCLLGLVACGSIEMKAKAETTRTEAKYPSVGQFIEIDGAPVHYTDEGSGPVVILLHGAGGNLRDWTFSLIPELSKTHRVIAFDRPGHGYTPTLHDRGESLAEQANLLHAASRALGVNAATVVGFSFGGAVSLRWALDQPDFVSGLVLVSAVSNPWEGPVDLLYRVLASPVLGQVSANVIGGFVTKERVFEGYQNVFRPQKAPDGFIEHSAPELSVRPKSFRANARQVATVKPQIIEQSKRYKDMNTPIEIIHGDADPSVPYKIHAIPLHEKAPNSHLTTLPGMGHGAHILAQEEILAAIKRLSK